MPRDYRDAFTVLEEQGAPEASLVERLRALAGLRNRLVHLYDDIDDRLAHAYLREGTDDLDTFARAISGLVTDDDRDEETSAGVPD